MKKAHELVQIQTIKQKAQGFALLAAIFLIVVLSAIAALLTNLLSLQSSASIYSLLGTKAYYAASSGIEWSRHIIVTESTCPASPAHPMTFSLNQGGFNNVSVTITCTETSHVDGATTYKRYNVSSLAEIGTFGSMNYASRTLQATIFT